MYREEVFEDMKSNGRDEHLYFRSVRYCKSKFAKDLARKINIRNGKSKNFVYTAPTTKHGRHMISLI